MQTTELLPKAATGIAGLDDILAGGLARNRLHLLEGSPGTGKTTIALQFLLAGAQRDEIGLYITLAETEPRVAGWRRLARLGNRQRDRDPRAHPAGKRGRSRSAQSLLYSSDLELGEATQRIFAAIERLQPKRVVIDSLSEIRLLAQSSLRYRRQILALKHYFARHSSTVVLLDDMTIESVDRAVHSIAHSVIHLDQLAPAYGGERRRLRVVKCRGQAFRSGYHDCTIKWGGVAVFPRLVAAEHRATRSDTVLGTGIAEFDALLGGGIANGSSTLVIGPAGVGKSTVILQFIASAVARGERAAFSSLTKSWGYC